MKTDKKTVIKAIAIVSGVIIIALSGLYVGRNNLLRHIADERIRQIEQSYGLHVQYEKLEFKGLTEIQLKNLSIVPEGRDTLLKLKSAEVNLRFWEMLNRRMDVKSVQIDGLNIHFIKQDSVANYDRLFVKKASDIQEGPETKSYAQRTNELLSLAFGFLPANGLLTNINITEQKDSNFVTLALPSLRIINNRFNSEITVCEDTLLQHWKASGELNHDTHTLKAKLYPGSSQSISVPYITRRFGAEVTFDTLSYSLTRKEDSNHKLSLSGEAKVSGLNIFHAALSPEVINLNRGELNYLVNIADRSIELDSTTTVMFNKLTFHPYLHASKEKQQWHFIASVDKPWFPADELFCSLPKGLFSNLEGIHTSGELAYHFLLDVDFALLDSLRFESELKEKNFRIIEYGATNLGKMSAEFSYTAYENGQPVRTFPVGPSWEHFTPLDSISPILQMCVLQSEDGAFFYHRGFLPDAMREALMHDLKVRRFARGGSTISMQIIKNVFLTRRKNFARKLEEALIVWLIETERLTSKERMYEVYLNIAEWGPMVYGIQEAANFYFNKRPSQLTTEESIFLASIIPKPKHFRSSFTGDMKLKENLGGYYRLITERLIKKGLVDEAKADSIQPDIKVTGRAREELETLPKKELE